MKAIKKIGVWMDNSIAHVVEFILEPFEISTIESESEIPDNSIVLGEKRVHNKEQNQHNNYFKRLKEVIAQYDEVILFGPTNAKTELFNILKGDHHFSKIKIEVQQTDKMTPNQKLAFVGAYFSGN